MFYCFDLDELPVFEETWNGHARQHVPGWSGSFGGLDNIGKIILAFDIFWLSTISLNIFSLSSWKLQ